MDEENIKEFDELDDELVVYRGVNLREIDWYNSVKEYNVSWSLDKEKAKWFSERFKNYGFDKSILLEGKVKKSDVWYYENGRKEKEIVSDKVVFEYYD